MMDGFLGSAIACFTCSFNFSHISSCIQVSHLHLSICLFVYPFLSFCLSVSLSVCFSVCLFVSLSVCLFVCLSVCLFVCLSVCSLFDVAIFFHENELPSPTCLQHVPTHNTALGKGLAGKRPDFGRLAISQSTKRIKETLICRKYLNQIASTCSFSFHVETILSFLFLSFCL